jgi:hypothetical protein
MQVLKEAFERARGGSGQVSALVGEAGMGKSRLLLEFSKSLPDDKVIYLEGRCFQHGGSVAYLPFLDILKSYFDFQESDAELEKKESLEKNQKIDSFFGGPCNVYAVLQSFCGYSLAWTGNFIDLAGKGAWKITTRQG